MTTELSKYFPQVEKEHVQTRVWNSAATGVSFDNTTNFARITVVGGGGSGGALDLNNFGKATGGGGGGAAIMHFDVAAAKQQSDWTNGGGWIAVGAEGTSTAALNNGSNGGNGGYSQFRYGNSTQSAYCLFQANGGNGGSYGNALNNSFNGGNGGFVNLNVNNNVNTKNNFVTLAEKYIGQAGARSQGSGFNNNTQVPGPFNGGTRGGGSLIFWSNNLTYTSSNLRELASDNVLLDQSGKFGNYGRGGHASIIGSAANDMNNYGSYGYMNSNTLIGYSRMQTYYLTSLYATPGIVIIEEFK
jgi:hypothetical protein